MSYGVDYSCHACFEEEKDHLWNHISAIFEGAIADSQLFISIINDYKAQLFASLRSLTSLQIQPASMEGIVGSWLDRIVF